MSTVRKALWVIFAFGAALAAMVGFRFGDPLWPLYGVAAIALSFTSALDLFTETS